MAVDKLVDSSQLNGALTATANAIRGKTGGSSTLTWDMDNGFKAQVEAITTPNLQSKTNINVSSSSQTISPDSGYNGLSSVQLNPVTTANISAANIKKDVVIKVGDKNSATRIANVTGTFTKASTVSSGQTAAAAAQIRSGYSAWVDGAEIKGSLGTTSVSQGTTTVSGSTATRGTASWGNGVISSGSIAEATFANTATSNTTYVDISNTTAAPVLVSNDYLYINKGYTDNLKISLAHLVPDGASADLTSNKILSGYSAYNNDGVLIAGNIASKIASNVTHSGKTVTVPAGYYASQVTHNIDDGTVVASISSNSSGSASMAATGFTAASSTTAYYVTLSTSAGSVKAKAAGDTSGYVTSSTTNETSATSVSVSGNGDKLYIPAGSITNNTTLPSGKTSSGTIARGNYIKIGAGYYPEQYWYAQNVSNGTITINIGGGTSSGTINRGNKIKIGAGYYANDVYYTAQANSGTKTITASGTTSVDGYVWVSVPTATLTFNGGDLSGIVSASGNLATISDSTNNSGISITTVGTAARADILYNGAVAGWIKSGSAVALSGTSTAMTAKTYYINEVTLPKGKSFGITVYTGASTTTKFVFTTDANGNTTVAES